VSQTVGIVGVGHLAGYLVAGWHSARPDLKIVLSPRNADQVARLAARYGATVASDNQAVVDAAGLVVVATRPGDVLAACQSVTWRPDHVVVSVAAGLALAALAAATAPARAVRAMPLACALIHESPTLLYRDDPDARALFAGLGPVHALPDEDAFTAASALGAWYACLYALFADAAGWAAGAGVPAETARALVLQAARGAAGMALAQPEADLNSLLATLATRGGITELALGILRRGDGLRAWPASLDAVLLRLRQLQSR
jgi:pyrroline-5-carboxylate reductase